MAKIPGTAVASTIVPSDSRSKVPTHDAKYGKDGLRGVDTLADMNAIPTEYRSHGMLVFVRSVQSFYECGPGPAFAFGAAPFVPGPSTSTIYASTAAGLAAVAEGEYFYVAASDKLSLYRDVAGVATLIGEFPTLATLGAQVTAAANSATAANDAKVGAETAQGLAEGARDTATTQAGIATTQAGIATTQAGIASGHATQAGIFRDEARAAADATPADFLAVSYNTTAPTAVSIAATAANGATILILVDESAEGGGFRTIRKVDSLAVNNIDPTPLVVIDSDRLRADLASTAAGKGASLAGFLASGANAVDWTVEGRLQEAVHLMSHLSVAKRGNIKSGVATNVTQELISLLSDVGPRPVILPGYGGDLVVEGSIAYLTSGNVQGIQLIGAGQDRTIFDNRVAGPMLNVDGAGTPSQFARGGVLSGFTVKNTTNPANSTAIQMRAQWFMKVSRIFITGMRSDGIRLINDNGDPDSSAYCEFKLLRVVSCIGDGFKWQNPSGTVAGGLFLFERSLFSGNTGSGIRLLGHRHAVRNCGIALNGGGGIVLPFVAGNTPRGFTCERTQFENNTGFHLDLQNALTPNINGNEFVYTNNPTTGIRLGDGASGVVLNGKVQQNYHRRDAGTLTAILVNAGASNTVIEDEGFANLTGVTKYVDNGTNTTIRESGAEILRGGVQLSSSASGSFTPNLLTASHHRVTITAPGAFTVEAPTGFATLSNKSADFTLTLLNSSGGAVTVSFASGAGGYLVSSDFVNPPNGRRMVARFTRDVTSGQWVQVGAWASDPGGNPGSRPPITRLNVNTTAVGNVGAGEDNLMTYSLPGNSLGENGRGVRVTAWGTTANNANPKTVKVHFGSAVILTTDLTVNQAGTWRAVAEVVRTGSNAQTYNAQLVQGGAATLVDVENGSLTQTDTSAIVVKCTGTVTNGGGGINDNDIVQQGMIVEFVS